MNVSSDKPTRKELFHFECNIDRSKRYHNTRRGYFDAWNTVTQFLAFLFGSVTVFSALSSIGPAVTAAAGIVVTLAMAVNIVLRSSEKARTHHELEKEFSRLEVAMIRTQNPTREDLADWRATQLDIETHEPRRMRVINILMHNEVCQAKGIKGGRYEIQWLRRRLAPFIDIDPNLKEEKRSINMQKPQQVLPTPT